MGDENTNSPKRSRTGAVIALLLALGGMAAAVQAWRISNGAGNYASHFDAEDAAKMLNALAFALMLGSAIVGMRLFRKKTSDAGKREAK